MVLFLKATGGIQGFSVDMETVRAYHTLNKERKEVYFVMKLTDDGKKVVICEKGPAKKKAAKATFAEKSKIYSICFCICFIF